MAAHLSSTEENSCGICCLCGQIPFDLKKGWTCRCHILTSIYLNNRELRKRKAPLYTLPIGNSEKSKICRLFVDFDATICGIIANPLCSYHHRRHGNSITTLHQAVSWLFWLCTDSHLQVNGIHRSTNWGRLP